MASPAEVKDNASVICDIIGSLQGEVDTAPAGAADQQDPAQGQNELNGGAAAQQDGHKTAASSGLSDEEQAVLAKMREVLQPVRGMTWPVGLTDNRK